VAISNKIEYDDIEALFLNPRLGRNNTGPKVPQEKILELMQDWTLDELAVSFLESGFWPQEALLVVEELLYGKKRLVVVEGNRRLAALKFLQRAIQGNPKSPKWGEIAKTKEAPEELFTRIPYIKIGSRKEIESFLGFRHVTGIKEWKPAEPPLASDGGSGGDFDEACRGQIQRTLPVPPLCGNAEISPY
jgi:hypothetical protein